MLDGLKNTFRLGMLQGGYIASGGSKKGQLMNLGNVFIGIGVALIMAAFVALILGKVGATFTVNSTEANITADAKNTIADMVDLTNPLGIVAIAGVIIGLLLTYLGFQQGRA